MLPIFSLLFLLPTLTLASPDPSAPFAIAQSTFGPNQESLINNDVQSFLATQTGAAFSSAARALATATNSALEDIFYDYRGDPNQLANEFFTATATPTWYSALPANLQQYVSGLAAEQASIASRDAGVTVSEPAPSSAGAAETTAAGKKNGAAGGRGEVGWLGAMLAAGAAGVAML